MLGSQLSKFEEHLDNCKKYKAFIDHLTPQEFFDEQQKRNAIRKDRKIREWEVSAHLHTPTPGLRSAFSLSSPCPRFCAVPNSTSIELAVSGPRT
jgi:hypothetical protein